MALCALWSKAEGVLVNKVLLDSKILAHFNSLGSGTRLCNEKEPDGGFLQWDQNFERVSLTEL